MEEMQIRRETDRHRRRYQTEKSTVNGIVYSTNKKHFTSTKITLRTRVRIFKIKSNRIKLYLKSAMYI